MEYFELNRRWKALSKEMKRKSTTLARRKEIEAEARLLFAQMWGQNNVEM